MFLGEYEHSLDAKGRLILPSKFRARLESGCVIAKGQDGCLYVWPREEWDRKAEQVAQASLSSIQARNFHRLFFSGASEQLPDGQGRVSVPEPLRRYANLDRDVTVIGAGPRFEIWDRESWVRHRDETERAYSEMTEASPEIPF